MILDTNAVSALAEKDSRLLNVIAHAPCLVLSFIAHAEFEYGLLGSNRPTAGLKLLAELADCIPLLLPDKRTLTHYARIKDELKQKGRPIPDNDIWIAALAQQHAMPILSRDRHFDFVEGIQRQDW